MQRSNDHDLCFQCYRDLFNQISAIDLAHRFSDFCSSPEESSMYDRPIRRHPAKVGDLIQYQYTRFTFGVPHVSLTTRRVIDVINDGAAFFVEGQYRVNATQIRVHIPMHKADEPALKDHEDDFEFCGARDGR